MWKILTLLQRLCDIDTAIQTDLILLRQSNAFHPLQSCLPAVSCACLIESANRLDPLLQLEEVWLGALVARGVCGRAITNDTARPINKGNGNVAAPTPVVIGMGQFCVQADALVPPRPPLVSPSTPLTSALIPHG